MLISAASSSSSSVATTGRRPTNSGISPKRIRSSGSTSLSSWPMADSSLLRTSATKPMPLFCERFWMIFSRPANAPPTMNRMWRVSTCRNSCWGCLRPPCGRHRGDGAFDQLQQRLLDALARHVAGDGRVVGLAGDLVDLVDVDDARLGLLDVVVALLQQLLDDVLDILAHVTGFGQRGRIGDRERHVEQPGQGLGQQRLAAAGGADQQDVALGELDVVLAAISRPVLQPLVVVVHRHGEDLLGALLADDVLVQDRLDLLGLRQLRAACGPAGPRAPRE